MRRGPNVKYSLAEHELLPWLNERRNFRYVTQDKVDAYVAEEMGCIWAWESAICECRRDQFYIERLYYDPAGIVQWLAARFGLNCSMCGQVHRDAAEEIQAWDLFDYQTFRDVRMQDIPCLLCLTCQKDLFRFVCKQQRQLGFPEMTHQRMQCYINEWLIDALNKEIRKQNRKTKQTIDQEA